MPFFKMSPVARAGPLTGIDSALGSYEKFQPGLGDEKRPKILRRSYSAKFEKQRKQETQRYDFCALRSFGNSYSCVTDALELNAYDVENTAGKVRRYRIHSKNSSRFHHGNLAEVFKWHNFPAR